MVSDSAWMYPPDDLMTYLYVVNWYDKEEAWGKLLLVAKYIDNPTMIRTLEERWLYSDSRY